MHLTASVRKFRRYIISTIVFVAFLAVYFRESWYLSSGDRAINRMNLCMFFSLFDSRQINTKIVKAMKQPPSTDPDTSARANAAIISLVRNSELDGMLSSMRQFESSFNARYSYPWVFFNNEPFTDEFKERTQAETSGQCSYGAFTAV
jgi:mannosyltransferase